MNTNYVYLYCTPCSSDSMYRLSVVVFSYLNTQLPPRAGWSMTVSWLCLGERDWWLRRTTACLRRRPALLTRTCRRGAWGRRGEVTWLYTQTHTHACTHTHTHITHTLFRVTVLDWVKYVTHWVVITVNNSQWRRAAYVHTHVLWYASYWVWDLICLCTYTYMLLTVNFPSLTSTLYVEGSFPSVTNLGLWAWLNMRVVPRWTSRVTLSLCPCFCSTMWSHLKWKGRGRSYSARWAN